MDINIEKSDELKNASSFDIVKYAVNVLYNKKASDIKVIKIDTKTIIADYFILCSGNSGTQVKSLTDELDFRLSNAGLSDIKTEGTNSDEWKIIDCRDVIVHVFSREARSFYNLEKLWCDCEQINLDNLILESGENK